MATTTRVLQRFTLAPKVAERFRRARAPQVTINGKKYVLSDVWGAIDDLVGQLGGGQPGGPQVIDMGSGRYSYLWAYDPDRMTVAMWRYSDGENKLWGKAGPHMRDIHKLQQKGQLNRVTTSEMQALDRAMRKRGEEALQAMKDYLEEQATDFERQIGKMIREFFKKKVEPKVLAQWVLIDQGILPDDFRPNERLLDMKPAEMQAKMHAAHKVFESEFSLDQIEAYIADEFEGLNPLENPEVDSQLAYWERNDVIEEFYDRHEREISAKPPEELYEPEPAPTAPQKPGWMTSEMALAAKDILLRGAPRARALQELYRTQGKPQGLGLKKTKDILDYVRYELETQGRV